jgi:hypothetical protein
LFELQDDIVTLTGLERIIEIDLINITVKLLCIRRVPFDYHYPTIATYEPSSQTFVKPLLHTQVRFINDGLRKALVNYLTGIALASPTYLWAENLIAKPSSFVCKDLTGRALSSVTYFWVENLTAKLFSFP